MKLLGYTFALILILAVVARAQEAPSMDAPIQQPPPFLCPENLVPVCNPANDLSCTQPCQQNPLDVPPTSIQATGITSVIGLLSTPGVLGCQHPVDGEEIVNHWLACGVGVDVLGAEVIRLQTELNALRPAQPSGCDIVRTFNAGDLYKPISDNTRSPVVLVGDEFGSSRNCDVATAEGAPVLACRFRTCCPNGNRAHFDILASGLEVERVRVAFGELYFRIIEEGTRYCWEIKSGVIRQE